MSYRVYTRGKLALLASGVDYHTAEYYRSGNPSVVIEDTANDPIDTPDNATLSATYGVRCESILYSAGVLGGCLAAGAVLLLAAWLLN